MGPPKCQRTHHCFLRLFKGHLQTTRVLRLLQGSPTRPEGTPTVYRHHHVQRKHTPNTTTPGISFYCTAPRKTRTRRACEAVASTRLGAPWGKTTRSPSFTSVSRANGTGKNTGQYNRQPPTEEGAEAGRNPRRFQRKTGRNCSPGTVSPVLQPEGGRGQAKQAQPAEKKGACGSREARRVLTRPHPNQLHVRTYFPVTL